MLINQFGKLFACTVRICTVITTILTGDQKSNI